jgi:hypothetical protein
MEKFQKHIIYWILPSVIILTCIIFYFFDGFHLSQWIAPELNREFGVIENLQLVIIILITATALKGTRVRIDRLEKNAFKIIFILSVILFLEEIDYGIHYYEYFINKRMEVKSAAVVLGEKNIRNIHNNWNLTSNLKFMAYTLIAVFFVLVPLIPKNRLEKYRVLHYLAPSKYIVTTAVSLLILNQVALYFYQSHPYTNQSLTGNVSEFEETMIYYIGFLYFREMIYKPLLFPLEEISKKTRLNILKYRSMR